MSDYYDTYKYTCPHCGEPAQVVEGLEIGHGCPPAPAVEVSGCAPPPVPGEHEEADTDVTWLSDRPRGPGPQPRCPTCGRFARAVRDSVGRVVGWRLRCLIWDDYHAAWDHE